MKTPTLIFAVVLTAVLRVDAASLGPATISAGAARLDNGSLVNIGQPFVGVMGGAGGGVTLGVGIIPVSSAATNVPPSPNLGQPRMVGGAFAFSFPTQPGRDYVVWASTNLTAWTAIRTFTAGALTETFSDPDTTNYNRRFYKVQVP